MKGLVGTLVILRADKALDIGDVGGIKDISIKQFPNGCVVLFIVGVLSDLPGGVKDFNGSTVLNYVLIRAVAGAFRFVSRIGLSWRDRGVRVDGIRQGATRYKTIRGVEVVAKAGK